MDRRRGTWYFRWREAGRRRSTMIGKLTDYPTKTRALLAVELLRRRGEINTNSERKRTQTELTITVTKLAERYESEKMPERFSTARMYRNWLNKHILPKWGALPITAVKPYEVELWLNSLGMAPKSRVHIRSLLKVLWKCAMLWEHVPIGRNPMELVTIKNASKRESEPTVLTFEQFQQLLKTLSEPYRTMVLVDGCLGLRFSELIALRWSDVDWLGKRLRILRAIVMQHEGDVKTIHSRKPMPLDDVLIAALRAWHGRTEFSKPADWIWASPEQAGELPYSYAGALKVLKAAASAAGIGEMAWHTFRHTYRSWLSAVGAPLAVQQKLMRHADIRTTMNIYGDTLPDELREAHGKVVRMVLPA